jgi:hypothetical protein
MVKDETDPSTRLQDPLLYDIPLPLSGVYFPMGFPVTITTNSRSVLRAAEEVWGECGDCFGAAPIELRFAVDESSAAERPPAVLPRGQEALMAIVHSPENFATADLSRGFAFGWLTPSVLRDRGYFRYHFLEPLVYVMLSSLYLTPVHAACVALDGSGVLLCGESGAGKTSLTYACARREWTYVADDASHLVRGVADATIVGRPHQIRFRSSAVSLFPELAAHPVFERANGKLDIEIQTRNLGLRFTAIQARADYLVFLNRGDFESGSFNAMDRERAAMILQQSLCCGTASVRQLQRQSLQRLLEIPVLELCYRDLNEAEWLLRSLVRTGA